jgi:hypothetical protein
LKQGQYGKSIFKPNVGVQNNDENELPFDTYETNIFGCILSENLKIKVNFIS